MRYAHRKYHKTAICFVPREVFMKINIPQQYFSKTKQQ